MIDVVIVGGGPNGLLLACEPALGGVRPVVLERRTEPDPEPRSNGLLGQVVRMVDRRGLFERLSGRPGPPRPNRGYHVFAGLPLDLGLLADSPVHTLPVPEAETVRVLAARADEFGVDLRRGHELRGLAQDPDGVTLTVDGPDGSYELRARYAVGADGAHSPVRKAAGIGFPGVSQDRTTTRTAHVTVPADRLDPATGALLVPDHGPVLPFLPVRTATGGFSYAPLPGGPPLVATAEWDQPATDEPMSLDEAERRPVADRTVTYSQAQAALLAPGDDVTGLRALFGELLAQPGVVRTVADLVAGADTRYPVADDAHPLAGWPAPDLDLRAPDGVVRLAELVRRARPLLIDLTPDGGLRLDGVESHYVDVVRAEADTDATALLLRPDSYVAWASSDPHPDREALRAAAERWFGGPVDA